MRISTLWATVGCIACLAILHILSTYGRSSFVTTIPTEKRNKGSFLPWKINDDRLNQTETDSNSDNNGDDAGGNSNQGNDRTNQTESTNNSDVTTGGNSDDRTNQTESSNDDDANGGSSSGFDRCTADPSRSKSALLIEALNKGLNNQREHILQDVAAAVLVDLDVVLPSLLHSRRNCGMQASCSQKTDLQSGGMDIWQVFDKTLTLQRLAQLGVCVRNTTASAKSSKPWKTPPILASEYKDMSKCNTTTNSKCIPQEEGTLWRIDGCCASLIGDTDRSNLLLQSVSKALVPAELIRTKRDEIIDKLFQTFKDDDGNSNNEGWIAFHWRGHDDVAKSKHGFSVKEYNTAVNQAFHHFLSSYYGTDPSSTKRRLRRRLAAASLPLRVFVLGGGNIDTAKIANDINAFLWKQQQSIANSSAPSSSSSWWLPTDNVDTKNTTNATTPEYVQLCTKEELLPGTNWVELFDGYNDIVGQVDFEVGVAAPYFLGTPASSFSVMVALTRTANDKPSFMLDTDVKTKLGVMQMAVNPYDSRLLGGKNYLEQGPNAPWSNMSSSLRCKAAQSSHKYLQDHLKCPSG